MSWQSTLSWENAQRRAQIIDVIRSFFKARKVLEIETPALSQSTITDVHLDALSCDYHFMADSSVNETTKLYLQTSPEFHMKRLLASGYGCIYQISKAFRHEEAGSHHNPEFTMLEWYRLGFDHIALMNEVSELLIAILYCEKPTIISYQDVFKQWTDIDPLSTNRTALLSLIEKHNKLEDWLVEDSKIDATNDMLLQFVFSEIVEKNIGKSSPCFVYDFPVSQASLAKVSITDPRVAHRFECYYKGIELVNGFNELTDATIQAERFNKDNKSRQERGQPVREIDMNFINALSQGLPQCAGVALGIDRLVMLALEQTSIESVITFPIQRA